MVATEAFRPVHIIKQLVAARDHASVEAIAACVPIDCRYSIYFLVRYKISELEAQQLFVPKSLWEIAHAWGNQINRFTQLRFAEAYARFDAIQGLEE